MNIQLAPKAQEDLAAMDNSMRRFFSKHIDKLETMPPRRHLQYGIPYFCEDVTHSARLVYMLENDDLIVVRCFATHKEYERWFRSFG